MIVPVLLSGGVGSRLWPVSRELYPKQFLPLLDEKLSLLQQTLSRVDGLSSASPMVVCNEEHRFLVAEQLRDLGSEQSTIVLEPVGRNTAPAVAAAAILALKEDPGATLLVLPADHDIRKVDSFRDAILAALPFAEKGGLVTFGIQPTSPRTGYGYIRRGQAVGEGAYAIEQFVEKPDASTAQSYLDSGDYSWNSGMFLLSAATYLEELGQHAPAIREAVERAVDQGSTDLDFVRLDKPSFEACPSDSIDYAVMEHTREGVVLPLDIGWSDVGAWSEIWEVNDQDSSGNVAKGDVMLENVSNSYVHADSRMVAAIGLEDMVVVETADAVLVSRKDAVQDVKSIVNQLKSGGRSEVETHTRVYRPWGSYESLVIAERFQVKRIVVNPGQALSLQMHHHRAEHWVVVSGTALVQRGEEEIVLSEDQSTYIPVGFKHRLTNPGVIPLELIEVQSGSYLGEDDIVRFEDVYGRSQ